MLATTKRSPSNREQKKIEDGAKVLAGALHQLRIISESLTSNHEATKVPFKSPIRHSHPL